MVIIGGDADGNEDVFFHFFHVFELFSTYPCMLMSFFSCFFVA